MSDYIYERIANLMAGSNMTVVLTGAGISTESGIPDFRSPGTGLWEKVDPMEALSADVLYNNPKKFYETGFNIIKSMQGAKPNEAHMVLAAMEKQGIIDCIVTQNIDNLHHEAGSKNVMEVHGSIGTGHCIKCGKTYKLIEMEDKVDNGQVPPLCICGGVIRTDVVLFGDSLPDCFNTALEKSARCDLMVVVGSSLQVGPVNYLPSLAKKLVIINRGETMYDKQADILCSEKASVALKNIYKYIQEIK